MCYGVATISRLLKIYVSFAKEPYKRDYILQKRPIRLGSLLIVATPYVFVHLEVLFWKISYQEASSFTWKFCFGRLVTKRRLVFQVLLCHFSTAASCFCMLHLVFWCLGRFVPKICDVVKVLLHAFVTQICYGVAAVSRIDKITGLSCRISSFL